MGGWVDSDGVISRAPLELIITLDDGSVTLDVSGQTLGDTIILSSGASNSGENMISKESSNSSNSNEQMEESSSASSNRYIYNCPVHNHHLDTSNALVCPDDPTCTFLQ